MKLTSKERKILSFANLVLKNDAKDDVIERISTELFKRFRVGTLAEREVVSNIVDSMELFFTELHKIHNEFTDIEPDIQEDINR